MDALTSANLLAWALQAGVIVLVAAPLPRLLGLWSPRVRMVFWRAVLVACLLLPVLQPWAIGPVVPASPLASALTVDVADVPPGATAVPAVPPAPPAGPTATWSWEAVARTVIVAGIVLRLAWLGLGLVTVGRLRRAASRLWPRPPSVDLAATLAETDAEFLVSATTSRPVTCGVLWPVVMVPRDFESFPEREQTAIACHELLHVSRADWVRNAGDEIVRAALWFHPAIWWLIDEIQLAREQVVDREAVSRLGTRQPYLEALLRLAKPAPRLVLTPASPFLKRAHLRQRVTLLLKEASMSRARLVASLAIMALVVFVAGRIVTSALPLQQSGAARPGVATGTAMGIGLGTGRGPGVTGGAAGGVGGGVGSGASGGIAGGVADGPGNFVVVHRADPSAPGLSGRAIVGVMIAAGGSVTLARPLGVAGVPYEVAPTQAAADAAKQWVFEPSDADGRTTILGFNLTPQNTSGLVDPPIQRVGGNVPPPKKLVDCKPVYPREAQDARIQGVQILELTLDPSGAVLDARALRGNPTLVRAAIDAVLQWQFEPWAGPDRRLMTVTVNFTLGDGPTTTSPGFGTPARDAAAAGVPAPVQYGRARDWPPEALRVGDAIKPPARIVDVRAVYPDIAQKSHVQGVVICDVLIGPDGRVKDARVVRSIPLLDQAAIDAVRQWEFTPTLLNGNPIPVVMTVTVNFTLQ